MKFVDYLDEDTGRIHKVMKTYNSNQYILRIPATIGRNPKFPFKHREVVKIRLEGERLIVEKLERKKE